MIRYATAWSDDSLIFALWGVCGLSVSACDEAGHVGYRGSCSAALLWLFLHLCFQNVAVDVVGHKLGEGYSFPVLQPDNSRPEILAPQHSSDKSHFWDWMSASALCERFPVFLVLNFCSFGTFLLVLVLGVVASFCLGCVAPCQPGPGPVTNIQLSSPGPCKTATAAASRACIHPGILSFVGYLICALVILRLMRIILDTGSCKDLKIGKAAMLSTERRVISVSPQVASWIGGLPAAAREDGTSKFCQAMSAAASRRVHVLPTPTVQRTLLPLPALRRPAS